MRDEELKNNTVEETKEVPAKTYSQEQVDDITKKVKENAVKNWVSETFKVGDVGEFITRVNDGDAKLKSLSEELAQTKIDFKKKDIRNAFINNYGGLESAFETMIKSNPEILDSENINLSLQNIKKTSPFLFMDDKTTLINLNEKHHKNFYETNDKDFVDGSKLQLK